ncbi:TonB-dependent receptor plug domain-containing protein [Sphingomonas flavalba]|uniref:TonB-dependent receptor plug domain-containing protein n=1 Tax=Sphingomonas flavalba TaxID=2559804 RepID=UPI0039E1E2B1
MSRATLSIACLLFGASSIAMAQAPTAADDGAAEEAIVVTGSRVVSDGTRAPTPLTVATTESLAANAPGGIAEGLNQLPVFQGAVNAQTAQLVSSNRVRSGNYLNLRNLGPQRVLVLQDGYRLPPSGNNGGVDTNVIPQMLIQRVETVTGGASAVYGSDAVSGVVNYITDTRFRGVKALAQAGLSTYGDGFSYRLGVAGGTALLDDRLRLQASIEYYATDGIPRRNARSGAGELWVTGARDPSLQSGAIGTINNPFLDYSGVTTNRTTRGGLITSGPAALRNLQFLPTGALVPMNGGTAIGRAGFGQGSDGPEECVDCTLVPESSTGQAFFRATYEAADELELFAQLSLNTDQNRGENFNLRTTNIPIYADNVYLQQQLTPAQLAALGTSSIQIARHFTEWDTRAKRLGAIPSEQKMKSAIARVGAAGGLGGDWKWDTAFTYGESRFSSVSQEIRRDKLFAAVDAVAGPNGAPVCRITQVDPSRFADCVPLNVLGMGRGDPAAMQWVLDDSWWRTKNQLTSGVLNVRGSLFSTWAGPVTVAFGGEIRKQKIVQDSNSDPDVPVDFQGIRGGNGALFSSTNVGVARGSYTVKEIYGEAVLPLIADAPFTRMLELNGAFRHADYSTSGGVDSFKIGGVWEPVSDIRLRAAVSRDIRAPSLFELFAGQTLLIQSVFDPVTNGTYDVRTRGGGNPVLKPEKADTLTLGVVLQPQALAGFYGSVDFYRIKIKDAIGTPGSSSQILLGCGSNPQSPLCSLITRDANNVPVEVSGVNNNVAVLSTKGVDFEFGYRADLGNGTLSARLLGTRLISYKRQDTAAADLIEYAGTSDLPGFLSSTYPLPKWRGNLSITYANDSFSIGVQERMIGSYVKSKIQYYVDNHIAPAFYTDINFSKNIGGMGDGLQMFATVNNLFNKKGQFFVTDQNPGSQLPTARALYDVMGRYITIGVRTRF